MTLELFAYFVQINRIIIFGHNLSKEQAILSGRSDNFRSIYPGVTWGKIFSYRFPILKLRSIYRELSQDIVSLP